MTAPIRLAISTCPNDTFAFHALINQLVDWQGLEFDVQLLDIQQLNDGLFHHSFDVAKSSFHAALVLADQWYVLPSGSALGFGVGPLLLAAKPNTVPLDESQVTLCPGQHTTATMLFRLFYPETTTIEHTVFSDIMPSLQNQSADFGVCIHEGRFTWQQEGLSLVEDLGSRWESTTKQPLPLGGILAHRSLPDNVIRRVQSVIQDSILCAKSDPESALPTMRRYAQEFNDAVLMQHVDLYVNDWTVELGNVGQAALNELSCRAKQVGLTKENASHLSIFG